MKLAVFGGSFNPVHQGHLILAEVCREACDLDEVWFVPAARSPHKQQQTESTDKQRLEMLALATAGNEAFSVSEIEIGRGGVSYTVDTLQQIHDDRPKDELFFLMGGDSLDEFHTWREPAKICELAVPIVVDRHGSDEVDLQKFASLVSEERMQEILAHRVTFPIVEISSSDLRSRVGSGQSIRYQTPRAVEKFIENAKLYRN